MGNAAIKIDQMSAAERLELLGELWESLTDDDLHLDAEQRDELLRRARETDEDHAAGRSLGTPWAEVKARLQKKNQKR